MSSPRRRRQAALQRREDSPAGEATHVRKGPRSVEAPRDVQPTIPLGAEPASLRRAHERRQGEAIVRAAPELAALGTAEALGVFAALGRKGATAERELAGHTRALRRLGTAGLAERGEGPRGEPHWFLTPRGNDVWRSIRGLVQ